MEELIKKRDGETNYEYGLRLIKLKKDGVVDIDWEEIVKLTGLELNKDSLRKANDTMYGGYNVAKYYEDKIANMLEKTQKKSIMDEFKEEIGEFRIAQQEARDRVNKMRALERKFIKSVEISKDIQDALSAMVGESLSQNNSEGLTAYLYQQGIISQREMALLNGSNDNITVIIFKGETR